MTKYTKAKILNANTWTGKSTSPNILRKSTTIGLLSTSNYDDISIILNLSILFINGSSVDIPSIVKIQKFSMHRRPVIAETSVIN